MLDEAFPSLRAVWPDNHHPLLSPLFRVSSIKTTSQCSGLLHQGTDQNDFSTLTSLIFTHAYKLLKFDVVCECNSTKVSSLSVQVEGPLWGSSMFFILIVSIKKIKDKIKK